MGTTAPDGLDRSTSQEHTLQVRGGDLVAEGGLVHVPELRERERLRSEREPRVRVRELAVQTFSACDDDRAVVERGLRQRVDRMPARIRRNVRIDVAGDEPEVRRRELPALGVPVWSAPRAELLEVRHLPHVDLRREVPEDRPLE